MLHFSNKSFSVLALMILTAAASAAVEPAQSSSDEPKGQSVAATQPTTAPSDVAVERARKLRAGIAAFELNVWYFGDQDKPFYTVTLHVAPMAIKKNDPFSHYAQITEAVAAKIIDLLLADGFLDRATDTVQAAQKHARAHVGYHYTVTERIPSQPIEFEEPVGWDLAMIKKLDALRALLDGQAATDMDFLINRLSGLRKQWENAKSGNEPAQSVPPK